MPINFQPGGLYIQDDDGSLVFQMFVQDCTPGRKTTKSPIVVDGPKVGVGISYNDPEQPSAPTNTMINLLNVSSFRPSGLKQLNLINDQNLLKVKVGDDVYVLYSFYSNQHIQPVYHDPNYPCYSITLQHTITQIVEQTLFAQNESEPNTEVQLCTATAQFTIADPSRRFATLTTPNCS